jgi:hypothetical protein
MLDGGIKIFAVLSLGVLVATRMFQSVGILLLRIVCYVILRVTEMMEVLRFVIK